MQPNLLFGGLGLLILEAVSERDDPDMRVGQVLDQEPHEHAKEHVKRHAFYKEGFKAQFAEVAGCELFHIAEFTVIEK